MTSVLVTVLGRQQAAKGPGLSYERVDHVFPDGTVMQHSLFAWSLYQRIQPERLVVFGTAGSMWDALVDALTEDREGLAELDAFREDQLMPEEDAQSVTQATLDEAMALLEPVLGFQPILRLHGDARTADAQQAFINELVSVTGDADDVHFDVTHGYRHLPLLVFAAGLYLRAARPNTQIRSVWYAMQGPQQGQASAIDLGGLLQIFDWTDAMRRMDWLGDYGAVEGLIEDDVLADSLRQASFLEQSHQGNVAGSLRKARSRLQDRPLEGAGSMFQDVLLERIRWIDGNVAHHQREQAFSALQRKDFLRAALYGVEAFVTRQLQRSHPDEPKAVFDRRRRDAIKEELSKHIDAEDPRRKLMDRLNRVRNRLVHGGIPRDDKVFASEAALGSELQKLLTELLPEDRP